jgi:ferritin-like protein
MSNTNSKLVAPELAAVEVHGLTRGAFLVRSALATTAVVGSGAVAPFISTALAKSGSGDVEILNFALTLEYLEAAFYKEALSLNLSSDSKTFASQFGDDETQHVDAITATVKKLGGKPAAMPSFSFPITDEASFLKLAETLEDTGVAAYNGAGPAIKSPDVLGAAGSIVQVEARHAAIIRLLNGDAPAPNAFDPTKSTQEVLAAVKPLIKA